MQYLSDQKLKAFAKRFLPPLTLEEASQAIESFVSLNSKKLKPSFIETRVQVLEICLQEKTPSRRWKKVRDYLVYKIESQVLNVYANQGILLDHEVEPWGVLSYLMNPDSFLCWCVKVVVIFNASDEKAKIPEDVGIHFGSRLIYTFPKYSFRRRKILLKANTKDGKIIEKLIPYNAANFNLSWGIDTTGKFSVTYSVLYDRSSKPHIIKHDEFYDKFTKSYKHIVKKYELNSSIKPSEWLSKLGGPVQEYSTKEKQIKLLKELTGERMTKWKWQIEGVTAIDFSKVVEEFFPDLKEEIVSILPGSFPLRWIPDNYLFDENSLRYELTDLYLQRFSPYERERLLMQFIKDLSIFNLKSFRDLIAKWESNKEIGTIIEMLEVLKTHYYKHKKDPKEREKWLEYVRINKLIQQGYKPMLAYRIASPNQEIRAVQKRYLRQQEKAKRLGYKDLEKIAKDWNLFEVGELIY